MQKLHDYAQQKKGAAPPAPPPWHYFLLLLALVWCMTMQAGFSRERTPYQPKTQQVEVPLPVTLPPPAGKTADLPDRPLNAEEAARLALVHQSSLDAARANLLAAQAKVQQANASLNPTLSGAVQYSSASSATAPLTGIGGTASTGSITGTTSTATSGLIPLATATSTGSQALPFTGYQISASLNQLLYDFNHTRDLVLQAKAKAASATYFLTAAQSDLVLKVKRAYYQYVQNLRLIVVNEKDLETQQQHFVLAQERYTAGVGLPSDVVRAEAAVSESIFNLTQARNDASVSRVNLATLMGIDPRTPLAGSDEPEPEPDISTPEKLYELALRDRPEMKQARATVEAAEHELQAAASTNAPALTGQAGWLSRGDMLPPEGSYFTSGLVLRFNLYDGGYASGKIKEALASRMAALALLETTKQNIISEVSQSYLYLRTAEQKMSAAKAGVANAEEAMRLNEGRYKAGVGTFIDVLDAQSALLQARNNAVNARSTYDQAKAALSYSIGQALK